MFRKFLGDRGLTLLEILLSLLILGVIAGIILHTFIGQYRLVRHVSLRSEINYSLLRAGVVLTSAVNLGQKVVWQNNALIVTYWKGRYKYTDSYYLADKNFDGKIDLYCEHLGVPNPVVTGLTGFYCQEVGPGLWKISLEADCGMQKARWERIIRQKCPGPI
ncbi:MAG: prepilin-type N-terminal cleavage/methylation domain-containing protein [Peptococcaceae bacterium]|nr:prepilin-type N-terminal cleavage/methylation domain-containing protein [Peptococcaceae bacterium]